jgi:arginyl-tRNA synthetase
VLTEHVRRVFSEWGVEQGHADLPTCELVRPSEDAHGDYATPICMQMAKTAKLPPRVLAEELRARLLADDELRQFVEGIEIAGPGFLNFTLNKAAYVAAMKEMLLQGDAVGRGPVRSHPRVNLEFVSVNPNGPLHVGHARYAAYGDSLHRLLVFSGQNVSAEFYINDYGRQMDRFGSSIAARYAQSFGFDLPVPEDGYQGEYVKDVAARIRAEAGDDWLEPLRGAAESGAPVVPSASGHEGTEWPAFPGVQEAIGFFRARGCSLMLEEMRSELEQFGVVFDRWFSETTLHESGRLERVIDRFLETGEAYREGDAVWLRTSSRGDDKDRVLIRSNEQPTYFAADIAYHEDKLERGFEHLINIWGADHHGYVLRMTAAVEILSGRAGTLEVIIGQLVNLLEEGELRQMSTRRGEMVTLAELIEAIGVDAARFFLVMRSHDQTLDLDLGLARQQSQENPVYYVQYAHARIASILRNMGDTTNAAVPDEAGVFESPYEKDLIKRLESFSAVVQDAAERRAPHRVAGYAQDLAGDFHVFYKHCRVIGVQPAKAASRLALCLVTKRVIHRCLDLLGVSAPESM